MSIIHTPGPWALELRYGHGTGTRPVITAPSADRVAICSRRGQMQDAEENAKRIVNCVNACDGVPNVNLPPGSVQKMIDVLINIIRACPWDQETREMPSGPEIKDHCILCASARDVLTQMNVSWHVE